ncbi:MAG TPA: hypothetical protein PLI64_02815 [Phycisphaerae bacterium]|jgi:hypothetical protein|nr:hypothetical protein [Phycisphaerae bacterium]HPP19907.1 hypothetical protein [Phycisphaerae bacterium]
MSRTLSALTADRRSEAGDRVPAAPPRAGGRFARRTLLLATLGASIAGAFMIAARPADQLALNIAIDDAFYYIVPARHLLAGEGYSLDGEVPTNGVQPFWALITIALCAVLPSDEAVVQAVVLLSGLLWIGAAGLLYLAMRQFSSWAAMVTAAGFALAGFGGRMAFQGMENGLHAFLCALIFWFGARHLASAVQAPSRAPSSFYLKLGLLLALVTLTRIDSAALAVIMGILVLAGLIRPDGSARLGLNIRGALWLAVPGTLLVGGMAILSYSYFGAVTPISGLVKLHYQAARGPLHGGAIGSLLYHARMLIKMSTAPIADNIEHTLWAATGAVYSAGTPRRIFLVALAIGGIILALRGFRSVKLGRAWHWYLAGLLAFVVVHVAVYAVCLSQFTDYGSWYFAPQLVALWLVYGVLLLVPTRLIDAVQAHRCADDPLPRQRLTGILACVATGCMLAFAIYPVWALGRGPGRVSACYRAGEWMKTHLPAGTRVGCFSAGIVSYAASPQRIINLDGLMNDRHYLENYLKPCRIPAYLQIRGAEYFCDYGSAAAWRSGSYGGLDLSGMQLVRWWPMWDDLSYGVWRILPPGSRGDVLDPVPGPCDRFSQIQFAAEVLGRFPVVPELQLEAQLREPGNGDLRVLTSIVEPSGSLRHVLAFKSQAAMLKITENQVDMSRRAHILFGNALELVGFDLPEGPVRRGERFVMTRYWRLVNPAHDYTDVSFELWLYPGRPAEYEQISDAQRIVHKARACHGTYPPNEWRVGEMIAETYSWTIPPEAPPGQYPVKLVLWDPSNRWLLPDWPGANPSDPGMLLGNIEVTAR